MVRLGVFNWTEAPKDIRLTGLTDAELKGVIKLGGAGVMQTGKGVFTVSLSARHSSIFRIDGANFDRLRNAMRVE